MELIKLNLQQQIEQYKKEKNISEVNVFDFEYWLLCKELEQL
mgnify:CR=1 FL=1